MGLEENVKAGIASREVIDVAREAVTFDLPRSAHRRFWENIAREACQQSGFTLVKEIDSVVMTEEESLEFERTVVSFGEFRGHRVADVPISYWLAITESSFNVDLRRWMRSPRFRRLQEGEE